MGLPFTLHDDNGWPYERAERWLADQACRERLSAGSRQRYVQPRMSRG